MPELFTTLIKINIALVLFCLGYYLVLRKLTFYALNRAYLITAILFSSAYPFIDLSQIARRQIVAPVQNVIIIWKAPAENLIRQASYWTWLELLFWSGVVFFSLRLLFQLASLYRIYLRSESREINGQNLRVVNGDISPFSFWQSIYINPDKLSPNDLQNVLEHEQIHVKDWHTLDVLLTEISVIFYWFNPGIWLMKRAVRENIEFITDRKILQKGLDSKAYQYSLLSITFNQSAPAITSNFNFSTLKKRIQMMNTKQSSKITLARYAFLVPVVVVCLLIVGLSKAEVVKSSPAFKTIAATLDDINSIALTNIQGTTLSKKDTTPTGKQTGKTMVAVTDTAAKTVNGTTITITPNFRFVSDTAGKTRLHYELNLRTTDNTNGGFIPVIDGKKVIKDHAGPVIYINTNGDTTRTDINVNQEQRLNQVAASVRANIARIVENKVNKEVVVTNGNNINTYQQPGNSNIYYYDFKKDATGETLQQIYKDTTRAGKSVKLISNEVFSVTNGITDFSNKLIIIDGNEATEKALKKISIGDIISMKELKGSMATDKYGKKGKRGVLLITTKNGKK